MGLGGQERELSHHTTYCSQLQVQKENNKTNLFYYSSRRKIFSLLNNKPMRDFQNSVNEKPHTSISQLTPMNFRFTTAPPNSPLSSRKGLSPPLFSRLACGFAIRCLSQIAIPLLFKHILLAK